MSSILAMGVVLRDGTIVNATPGIEVTVGVPSASDLRPTNVVYHNFPTDL